MGKNQEKFELATLDPKNLVELEGFKEDQVAIVENNPFQAIEDRKTYEVAKERRTALKSARTKIEKQDKMIGSVMSSFRKGTIAIKEELVLITKPSEEKQQEEVTRWETVLEEERNEKAKMEEERIEKINNKIESIEIDLNYEISITAFGSIEESKKKFDKIIQGNEFDFEEYVILFDDMVERLTIEWDENVKVLNKEEEDRVTNLIIAQQGKIDSLFRVATEVIENYVDVSNPEGLSQAVEDILDINYDFSELQTQSQKMMSKMRERAFARCEWLKTEKTRQHNEEIQIQKDKVNNLREGLLDLVHQITVDNYEQSNQDIKFALDQTNAPVPHAQEEFKKMVERVGQALKLKMEWVNKELTEKINEENKVIQAEEERMIGVMKERSKKIVKLGMVEQESETEWIGFGITITDERLYQEEDIQTIVDEIKEAKSNSSKGKKRQTLLKKDKTLLINNIERIRDSFKTIEGLYKNKEVVDLSNMTESDLNQWCDAQIQAIKLF